MSDLRDLTRNIAEQIHHTKKDKVVAYTVSESRNVVLMFSEEELLIFYYLLRFSYFDKEVLENIYVAVTRKAKVPNNWFYNLVGKSSSPISIDKAFKDGRKKVYYLNRRFTSWLIDVIQAFDSLYYFTTATEYDDSIFSIATNQLLGGKPKTINIHDLQTRRLVSEVFKNVSLTNRDKTLHDLNVQIAFPVSRVNLSLVPDGVLFIQGEPYYIEYDRATERQTVLLAKVLGYATEPFFEGRKVFFVFETKRKDIETISPRLLNMLGYVNDLLIEDTTCQAKLEEKGISLYAQTTTNAGAIIPTIMQKQLSDDEPTLLPEDLNELKNHGYEVSDIVESFEDDSFPIFAEIETDDWESVSFPIISAEYIVSDLISNLTALHATYEDDYEHIIILFPKEALPERIALPCEDFFLPVYI